jgi:hypothetical protein
MGTHYGVLFVEPLFDFAHFHVLQPFFLTFLLCFFLLLANDIHILNLASCLPFTFDHSTSQLALMGLVVQPRKCFA